MWFQNGFLLSFGCGKGIEKIMFLKVSLWRGPATAQKWRRKTGIHQAVAKDLTSSWKFSGSCVLTLQTIPKQRERNKRPEDHGIVDIKTRITELFLGKPGDSKRIPFLSMVNRYRRYVWKRLSDRWQKISPKTCRSSASKKWSGIRCLDVSWE